MLWAYSHSAHSPSVIYSHIVLSNCKEDRKMWVIRYNVCLELCLWHRLFFWSIILPFFPHIVHSYPFPKGGQSSSKFKSISSSWSKSGISKYCKIIATLSPEILHLVQSTINKKPSYHSQTPNTEQRKDKWEVHSSHWSLAIFNFHWAGTESPLPLVWSYFLIRLWLCPQESSSSSILLHGPQLHFLDVFLFSVIFLYYIWRECQGIYSPWTVLLFYCSLPVQELLRLKNNFL